jgi:hypothetical protein
VGQSLRWGLHPYLREVYNYGLTTLPCDTRSFLNLSCYCRNNPTLVEGTHD